MQRLNFRSSPFHPSYLALSLLVYLLAPILHTTLSMGSVCFRFCLVGCGFGCSVYFFSIIFGFLLALRSVRVELLHPADTLVETTV